VAIICNVACKTTLSYRHVIRCWY